VCLQWFSSVFRFFLQVFQLFRTYIISVVFRCSKTRPGVARVAMGTTCRRRLLQLLGAIKRVQMSRRGKRRSHERSLRGIGQRRRRSGGADPMWGAQTKCKRGHSDVAVCLDVRNFMTPLMQLPNAPLVCCKKKSKVHFQFLNFLRCVIPVHRLSNSRI
jgi:hypothetical protein